MTTLPLGLRLLADRIPRGREMSDQEERDRLYELYRRALDTGHPEDWQAYREALEER